MDAAFIEQLLHEDESSTLDFKRDQYKFAGADDNERSELLKDILGFANGWRRAEGFILIGVEEVVGGRSSVFGISEHLPDHSLQQFVNNLTNRPIRFGYETFAVDGKQIGVIRIDLHQDRPIYLKKEFGKLHKDWVYVRRGTSTDLGKPASPEEIALMGKEAPQQSAQVVVEFAKPDRDVALGASIPWTAECYDTPDASELPILQRPSSDSPFGIDLSALEGFSTEIPNRDFYRQLAEHVSFQNRFQPIRLVVTNTGKVAATNVRIELAVPKSGKIHIVDESDVPDLPQRSQSRLEAISNQSLKGIRRPSVFRSPGSVEIDTNDDRSKLEIECGEIQPGRKVWSEEFYIGIDESDQYMLNGHAYAANLPEPMAFTLSINADVANISVTVDQFVEFADSLGNESSGGEDEG